MVKTPRNTWKYVGITFIAIAVLEFLALSSASSSADVVTGNVVYWESQYQTLQTQCQQLQSQYQSLQSQCQELNSKYQSLQSQYQEFSSTNQQISNEYQETIGSMAYNFARIKCCNNIPGIGYKPYFYVDVGSNVVCTNDFALAQGVGKLYGTTGC